MNYRPEIDGLRAVAVLPVILFHAGVEAFSGGFVGVDVFFVISGFLITSIILHEMREGRFSLAHFYERRIRRILPLLLLVSFVSFAAGWFLLFPSHLEGLGKSLIATATFSSNILFWRESGYWGIENALKPLLHTWSLAVEEQYYIFFPLLLMMLWRRGGRLIWRVLVVLVMAGLLLSWWGSHTHPDANYFLLPTRFWEIGIGALGALALFYANELSLRVHVSRPVAETLALAGLAMVAASVFLYDENTPFPGPYALLPVLGTLMLLLFAREGTGVAKALGWKPLVGLGILSYGIYLWHQPLLAFVRHASLHTPSDAALLTAALLSIPLAYLSYRLVENPLRRKRGSRRAVFVGAFLGIAFLTVAGSAAVVGDGFPTRKSASGLTMGEIDQKLERNPGLHDKCNRKFTLDSDCRTSPNPEILVWGDSFAMHLVRGILASNPDVRVIQLTKGYCGPVCEIVPVHGKEMTPEWAKGCLTFNQRVLDWLDKNSSVRYVVLSSPLSQYLEEGTRYLLPDGSYVPASERLLEEKLDKTIRRIERSGKRVIFFTPPPNNGENIGLCLAKADLLGLDKKLCDFTRDEIAPVQKRVYRVLRNLQMRGHRLVHLEEILCRGGICRTHEDGIYFYHDRWHLSKEGSVYLGRRHDFYRLATLSTPRSKLLETASNDEPCGVSDEKPL